MAGEGKLSVSEVAAKGGKASAAKLTPQERSEKARAAVQARWAKEKGEGAVSEIARATHAGEMRIGDITIPCFVLENGMRVISHRGLQQSLGRGISGGARNTAHFLAQFESKVRDGKDLTARVSEPLHFVPPNFGRSAYGYEATVLADICDVILEARQAGVATGKHVDRVAARCEILVRGFARVGIIALVDEATGYQDVRPRDDLHRLLALYISNELLPWAKRFPDEFYKQLFRLRGWQYNPMSVKRPRLVGRLTELIVYKKLPPGVLEKLKEKNPKNESGRRRHKHHEFLTDDIGNPHLEKHLAVVTALMRASPHWDSFKRLLARAVPTPGEQLGLFDELDAEEEVDSPE
jgi:hypothetical protein